jgi:adenine-specific DNA-methyltransferase
MTAFARKQRKSGQSANLADLAAESCEHHSTDAVRAALIRHWLKSQHLSLRHVRRCAATARLLDSAETSETKAVLREFPAFAATQGIKELELAFETLTDAHRRRSHGVVYTPGFIIDYLIEHALQRVGNGNGTLTICDPACGSGGFLLRAAQQLSQRFGMTLADAFRRGVIGIDTDDGAVSHARCLAELLLAQHGQYLKETELRIASCDTLLAEPEQVWQAVGVSAGFDVVATNPPYVKLQNLPLEYRERLMQRYSPYVKGSFSLALLFLLAGHRLLAKGGCLAMITQNNLFTSMAGQPIRRYLHDTRSVRRIIDFGHTRVFDNASAYTCLLFLGTDEQPDFEFDAIEPPLTPQSLARARFSRIPLSKLNPVKWRLAKGRHLENLRHIESTGLPLGKIAATRVGFATLKDRVFLVRDIGGQCLVKGMDGRWHEIERDITRPAVKIADVDSAEQLAQNSTRVIFPYHRVDSQHQIFAEDELRDRFPRAYRHLTNWRPALDGRDKGKRASEAWYAWGRTQGREAPGPKLLTKTFNTRPNFLVDRSDQLFCNGYCVSLRTRSLPEHCLPLEGLQRILNSKIMHYYAKLTSFQIEGGYQCYQKNFIEQFGIPTLDVGQVERLAVLPDEAVDEFLAAIYDVKLADILAVVS